jgi:SAM-dependent methyltransferase
VATDPFYTVERRLFHTLWAMGGDMAAFWDAAARADAYHYVDDRQPEGSPDTERFWAGGEEVLEQMAGAVGAPAIQPGDTVLDIGCGLGRLSRQLAARAARVLALDVSAEMLARAGELNGHLDNVQWIHGDGRTLSGVGDRSVDAAVSFVVFQHVPDPAITLGYVAELGRVLRGGGWALVHVSNEPSVHRGSRLRLRRKPKDAAAWMGSAVNLDDVRATARGAGLDVERTAGEGTQFCFVLLRATRGA